FARRERSVGELLRQRRPRDKLHAEEGFAILLADFVNGNDMRMLESGRSSRLGPEAREIGSRGQCAALDHLEGHDAPQALLARLIDDPHPSFADALEEFVIADRASRAGTRSQAPLLTRSQAPLGNGSLEAPLRVV